DYFVLIHPPKFAWNISFIPFSLEIRQLPIDLQLGKYRHTLVLAKIQVTRPPDFLNPASTNNNLVYEKPLSELIYQLEEINSIANVILSNFAWDREIVVPTIRDKFPTIGKIYFDTAELILKEMETLHKIIMSKALAENKENPKVGQKDGS